MKKIMAIFSVLAAVFVFASCDDVLKEIAPKDTWIAEPIDYQVENKTVSLMCYLYYSDSGTTTPKETIDPGLTIIVRASTDAAAVEFLGSGGTAQKYIIKNFPKDTELSLTSGKVTINDTVWAGLGIVRDFSNKKTGTPECLTMAGYTKFSGSFTDENWNKILALIITESVLNKR